MKQKRHITPHKGGRDATFPRSRLTKDVRRMLDELLELHGISASDWVTPLIVDEYIRTFGDETRTR